MQKHDFKELSIINGHMRDHFLAQEICPHCKASLMEYYGFTFSGLHYYYKCLKCQRYTEYRLPFKKYLLMTFIILIIMVSTIALFFSALDVNSSLAGLVLIGSVLTFGIVSHRYRWYLWETIPLEEAPNDEFIFRVFHRKARIIITSLIVAVLFVYACIFISNLIQQ